MHERRERLREMFVPLRHDPGHTQVDFGEALAVIEGIGIDYKKSRRADQCFYLHPEG